MRELKSYIFRNYGYKLTDEELYNGSVVKTKI